jgi:hypothetical protein
MDGEADRQVGGRGGLRAALTLALSLIGCLSLPAIAAGEVVTIGTPTAAFAAGQSSAGCNCTQYQLTAPAAYTEKVPAAGVIIDWRVLGSGTLTLEALRTAADGSLSVIGEGGGGQYASTGGIPAQPADIPVLAGDSIGVHLAGSSPKIYNSGPTPGATIGEASPDVPATLPTLQTPSGTLDLNADVAITPVVSGLSVTSGTTGGGTVTTITGMYLDGSTSVRFGGLNASSFTIVSPTEIVASAPAQSAGTVDVTVGGPGAASATSSADKFTYVAPVGQQVTSQSPGSPGGPTGVLGGSALVLSPLSLSASHFLAAASGASIAKTATGTTLTYTVSAAATTTFVVEDVLPGRLLPASSKGGPRDCVAPNAATLPVKLPKCTRYVGLTPYLTHRGPAGLNSVHLTGRLNGRALAPGSYRLLATAMSTATPTELSASVTHSFRILAPPKPAKTKGRPTAHAALPSTGTGATAAPSG